MKLMSMHLFVAGLLTTGMSSLCVAETIETDWIAHQTRSAVGNLGGVLITAATSTGSEFDSIVAGRFAGGAWNASRPLSDEATSLVVSDANPGDTHTFIFTQSISEIDFYIENFDSNSAANIKVEGDATLQLLVGSESISYSPTTANSGVLSTSNTTSDGEGDLIMRVVGDPASLSIDFTSGDGLNGVFYTFAQSVPEPASGLALLFGMVFATTIRKRRLNKITR